MASALVSKSAASLLIPSCRRRTAAALATMSSAPPQSILQLKLDPLTGNSEWVVIDEWDDGDGAVPPDFQKSFLATTSYLDMLNDSRRNRCYREAIDKTITGPCHVLDIGAGTGFLSMMAARAMTLSARDGHDTGGAVTACESYLPMVKLMRKVVHINGMGRKITIINKRSDEVKIGVDIESRADVLVSEILDSELLGEGLIPTLQHAHDMLLAENPQTVPYKATIFGQLVECKYLQKLHNLREYEDETSDGVHLVPAGFDTIVRVKRQQHPMHCDAIAKEIRLLSEPFKVFEFDFWRRPECHREMSICTKATCDGQAHGLVSWWELQLDHEGTIFYSTAPGWISSQDESNARSWCDHWKQCVWFIPGRGLPLSTDENVSILASHNDTSVSYQFKTDSQLAEGDFHIVLSPERMAICGDSKWRHSIHKALLNAMKRRALSLCIVADDSIFLALLIARLAHEAHVMALFPGLREDGASYLQAISVANGFKMDRVEVLKKRPLSLNMLDTHHKKVDLLISEPFYHGYESTLPWQNLRFWKERSMLNSVLSKDALIMPCKGILKVCAMFLPDLWNSRRPLGKIEGFDHSVVNTTIGASGDSPEDCPCLPYFVWQCGEVKELSKTLEIMEFDFSREIHPCCGKTKVEFSEDGTCHGFVLWIDWVMHAEDSVIVSTGPGERYWKQGVKLLPKPLVVEKHGSRSTAGTSSLVIETSFNPSNGQLSIKHSLP